jgi:hypothetical protein
MPQLYGGVSPALVNAGAFASTQTEEAPESAAGTQTSRKVSINEISDRTESY